MRRIFKVPYLYWLIGIFIIYIALAIIVSDFITTARLIPYYLQTINWFKLGTSIFLTLVIGFLVAMNAVFFYIRYKERKQCREGGTIATLGTLGGLATGVCPLCITGILPLTLSALGISFSFASLPFGGIEVQILVVVVLIVSLLMLKR